VAGFNKGNCCFRDGLVTFQILSFLRFFLGKRKESAPLESLASRWGKKWLVSVRTFAVLEREL
jgi:hypothetical protein